MSAQEKPGKRDLARGWQTLEKLAAEDDRAWLETASDEEVEARMNEAGVSGSARRARTSCSRA
jgi:hypothetical protein